MPNSTSASAAAVPMSARYFAGAAARSMWPPNSCRIADNSRLAKSSWLRELKRANNAVASTGTGTPASMAVFDGPAAFAGVRYFAEKPVQLGLRASACAREVEKPGANDAAVAPQLRNGGEVEVVREMRALHRQRRGLGVDALGTLPGVGLLEQVEPFGVRGHEPVLDAVVHHLHEVAGAARTAVQVAAAARCRRLAACSLAPGASAVNKGVSRVAAAGSPPIIRQ